MANLEGALKKLDRLTQEEARMALAEVLRISHSVSDEVKVVDGKVENVVDKVEEVGERVADVGEDLGDRIEDVGEKVEDIGNKIGDKVQSVSEKVQVVIEGARRVSTQLLIPADMYTYRRQGSKGGSAGSQIDY